MRHLLVCALLAITVNPSSSLAQNLESSLQIYWIDVEGGSATLVVTPSKESVLMDAGWARSDHRDALRIEDAMRDAGIEDITFFIASHFHGDHVGGVTALASRVPIGQFVDHGDSVEQSSERGLASWDAYLNAADGKRRTVKPGDKLPLRGLEFSFVLAHAEIPDQPLMPLGPNPYCEAAHAGEEDMGENARSVGYLLSLGAFQFLDLGDATVNVQHALACPDNMLGEVDIYQIPHHGNGIAPQLTSSLTPSVAIINNGPHKGGSAEGFDSVSRSPNLQDIWQIHRPLDIQAISRTADELTANLVDEDECRGHWLKAVVNADGRNYSVSNGRTGFSRTYLSR